MHITSFIELVHHSVMNGTIRPSRLYTGNMLRENNPFAPLKIQLKNTIEIQAKKIKKLEKQLKEK